MRAIVAALLLLAPVAARAEGMPQLEFGNPLLTSQVVWGVVIFAILYVVTARFALPQVSSVLEERAAHIASDLEAARAAKLSADGAVAELTEATRDAHAGAQAEIAQALEAAKARAAVQSAEANARLDTQIAESEQRIDTARKGALAALGQVAGDTAHAVVGRLAGATVPAGTIDRAVAVALAARRPA